LDCDADADGGLMDPEPSEIEIFDEIAESTGGCKPVPGGTGV